jgi:hypothetical protein
MKKSFQKLPWLMTDSNHYVGDFAIATYPASWPRQFFYENII